MRLFYRHRRTIYNCNDTQCHRNPLRPAAPQHFGSKVIVGNADDRKRTRIDDRHRVQQCGNRRRRNRSRRQPVLKRKKCRFDAKPDKGDNINGTDKGQAAAECFSVQHTTVDKLGGFAQHRDKAKPDKGKGRAADVVAKVLHRDMDRFLVHLVADQRSGDQRQQLIKKIHRDQVCRKSNAQCNTKCRGIKGKEPVLSPLRLHIAECVQARKRPQKGHQQCKYHRHSIHPQCQRHIARERNHRDCRILASEHRQQRQDTGQQGKAFNIQISCQPLPEPEHQKAKTADDRHQYRQQHKPG